MVTGPPVHATTIIFCTGYSEPRSFLPPSCPAPFRAACRLIVAPEWPTIVHMGHIRFWDGAIGPTAEMQAMWYLAYLEGRMKQLPKSEAQYSLLSPEGGYMSHGVDYSAYMATLAEDIGAKPKLLYLLLEYGWEVLWAYCFGACFVSFYRLIGPFKEAHQMRIMVKGELLCTVEKKGWIGIFVFGMIPTMILGLLNGLAWMLEIVGLLRLMRIGRRARSTMSRSVV
jgi:dimethylaniline monooxygenase (N-oxide forming)